jgi:hypothetical protein
MEVYFAPDLQAKIDQLVRSSVSYTLIRRSWTLALYCFKLKERVKNH